MQIDFTTSGVRFRLHRPALVRRTIEEIAVDKGFEVGYLHYIFCGEEEILEINRQYLGHDYVTDVITFPYTEGLELNSDIYICVPQVLANAEDYRVSPRDEMLRVVFHAVLHLVGYDDHTDEEIAQMRAAEERYMASCKARAAEGE